MAGGELLTLFWTHYHLTSPEETRGCCKHWLQILLPLRGAQPLLVCLAACLGRTKAQKMAGCSSSWSSQRAICAAERWLHAAGWQGVLWPPLGDRATWAGCLQSPALFSVHQLIDNLVNLVRLLIRLQCVLQSNGCTPPGGKLQAPRAPSAPRVEGPRVGRPSKTARAAAGASGKPAAPRPVASIATPEEINAHVDAQCAPALHRAETRWILHIDICLRPARAAAGASGRPLAQCPITSLATPEEINAHVDAQCAPAYNGADLRLVHTCWDKLLQALGCPAKPAQGAICDC